MKPARWHRPRPLEAVSVAIAALLLTASVTARAHDTWFEQRPSVSPDALSLVLGTGIAFPVFDSGIDAKYLVQNACRGASDNGKQVLLPLKPQGNEPVHALLKFDTRPAARTCWAELTPFEIVLPADKIPVYLKEIAASEELRATWAGIAARKLPWHETYTKYARVELGTPSAEPAPIDLDLLIEGATRPLKAGDTLRFRLLRDGKPFANQPVELIGDRVPFGVWRQTDVEGRAQVAVPASGHWVLRSVDLRLSSAPPDRWVSRFVTLAFEVGR